MPHGEDCGTQLANLVQRFDLTLEPMASLMRWVMMPEVTIAAVAGQDSNAAMITSLKSRP